MIARELLVKLGFDIDSTKLDKFNASIDNTKRKMIATRASIISNFAPEVSAEIKKINAYNRDLKSLSPTERAEVLNLNKIENQAIREVTKTKKAELKEQENLDKEAAQKEKNLQKVKQRDLKNSMASMASIGRKFAIVGASITAGFGLSIRSTLKDAANFKEGKSLSSFDKSQIATVDSFNRALNDTQSTVANLRNSFTIALLPAIEKTLKIFNAWVQKNKARILEKLKKIVDGLSKAFEILSSVIGQLVSAIDFAVEKTVGWEVAISSILVLGASAWFLSLASSVLAAARAFKVLAATSLIGPFVSVITNIRTIGLAIWFRGLIAPILAAGGAFGSFGVALLSNPITWILGGIASAFTWLIDEMVAFRSGGKTTANLLKEWGGDWAIFGEGIEKVFIRISNVIDAFKELNAIKISKSLATMLNPFSVFTDNEVIQAGFAKLKDESSNMFHNGLSNLGQSKLNYYNYTPEEISKVSNSNVTNNARSANVTNKNSFYTNITVPAGTSEEQAISIEKIVKSQIEKHQSFQDQKTLAAIGSY